ncbi:integrase [Flavipsychrobacter stenotrophus]|uniref:Integrase n=1 Tax=Flavipsychrobacter stenotrophus TaxID=2077091 RepID=A0A2S7SR41_9BACT|nr:site-specific integrase [Flavipsychrobacter stenotrophus]PQJ09383.1 integrase [Flavipsychrobacter stenotrophus]
MSVTIRKKPLANGLTALYLDVYQNGKRHKENLENCRLVTNATTVADRKRNKEIKELAENIRVKREQEIISLSYDVVASFKGNVDFIEYFENYISNYTKKDKRNMEGVCKRFQTFMKNEGIKSLTMRQLTESIVYKFSEYLMDTSEGEGASSYFKRFKKMIKNAHRDKIILSNPAEEVTIKRDESLIKSVLTSEEIQILSKTPISNQQVRNSFLFCCHTGLAWIDVKELRWKNINLRNGVLTKNRAKTNTETVVQLNKTAQALLPEPLEPNEIIFSLPSPTGALKLLKNWVNAAEIGKHVTWHCARHTFATNLIYNGVDVMIVAKLLGHSSLKYVLRYARVAEELKRNAVNSLPQLEL